MIVTASCEKALELKIEDKTTLENGLYAQVKNVCKEIIALLVPILTYEWQKTKEWRTLLRKCYYNFHLKYFGEIMQEQSLIDRSRVNQSQVCKKLCQISTNELSRYFVDNVYS